MQVIKILPVGFAANSYLLTNDGKTAVAIDPAQPRILGEAQRRGLAVKYILLTHGHFDHIGGCNALQGAGAKAGCLTGEEELALQRNLGGGRVPPFAIDFTFADGDTLSLCGMEFTVLATPGHTAGSACFLSGDKLFTGDTLFAGSVGRTDLPTGSVSALRSSLKKLCALGGDLFVYPGHGEDTTLAREREQNPYLGV